MKTMHKGFVTILILIGLTTAVLVCLGVKENAESGVAHHGTTPPANGEAVSITAAFSQEKILTGSDGMVSVALTLTAEDRPVATKTEVSPVDLIVVLDRSGSMGGQKIEDAKRAILQLIGRLDETDRLGLVAYANDVQVVSPLVPVTGAGQEGLSALVRTIGPGGGTNLGAGLQSGIDIMKQSAGQNRQRRIILLSDGLANHGIIDPARLGEMAGNASEHNITVSTVGVGYDFNEVLMTKIADHGSGNYYFLENPQAFAEVFIKEFEASRMVAAAAMELQLTLENGSRLVDAGGFPINYLGHRAIVPVGDLMAGQHRRIFLSYQVPTGVEQTIRLGDIALQYQSDRGLKNAQVREDLTIACINDPKAVYASIDKEVWSQKVVREEFGKLKEQVAGAIKSGKKDEALQAIQAYEDRNTSLNKEVESQEVGQNLQGDVQVLRQSVNDTFAGSPSAVAEKKQQQAKSLQYEGYQSRRDKK